MTAPTKALLAAATLLSATPWLTRAETIETDGRQTLPLMEKIMMRIDTTMLQAPEGIWKYADEEVAVAIWRSRDDSEGHYILTVVGSEDPALSPGDTIGYLKASGDPAMYTLTQYRRRHKGILDLPGSCLATLAAGGQSMSIQPTSSLKITLNPFSLLPRFWRIVRLSERKGHTPPREGLRRLYPSDDGPGILNQGLRCL